MSFNLNDEIRDGVLVSSKMKRIWKVNMNLLAELDRVCNKYKIKYKTVVIFKRV